MLMQIQMPVEYLTVLQTMQPTGLQALCQAQFMQIRQGVPLTLLKCNPSDAE